MSFLVQQTINGLALGSAFALYALGFSLVFANLKAFHVAHAAVFTWAAVFVWYLTHRLGGTWRCQFLWSWCLPVL
jgi:branched-chain amino acid transport system permease protein